MGKGWLVALLLVAGGAAWLFASRDEPAPFVTEAQAAIEKAGDTSLEKAADYWLAASNRERAKDHEARSGTALALAIRFGRLEAIRSGVEPIPAALKRKFRKHYDQAVLEGARWTVAQPGSRLGRVLARWPVKEGAVTLGNVVVFKTERASRNTGLFAHELAHVEQYRDLGVAEFARRYAADPRPIESEARRKSRRVMRSI